MSAEDKRLRRNLLQRERRQRVAQGKVASEIEIQARQEATEILQKAREESANLLSNAESRLAALNEEIRHREEILERERIATVPASCIDSPDLTLQKRKNRAASQKRLYWKRKELALQSMIQDASSSIDFENRAPRTIYSKAQTLVKVFEGLAAKLSVESKKKLLRAFWRHRSLYQLQPSILGDPRLDASMSVAFSDMKQSLTVVKAARRTDHRATKHAILTAFSGKKTVTRRQQSSIAKALGVKRQSIYNAAKKRKALDEDPTARFPLGERKTRSDKISGEMKQVVQTYWETRTRVSPNQKDTCRNRLGRNEYESHQVHWLEETEAEFFLSFQEWSSREGLDFSIGLRAFQHLKPYYVRKLKDRNVCCCKQHVEMDLLKDALNKFRIHSHDSDKCACTECPICNINQSTSFRCEASKQTITSVREWCEEITCPKQAGQQWHGRQCIEGKCPDCGISKLKICENENQVSSQHQIAWHAFEYVEIHAGIKGGKEGDRERDVEGDDTEIEGRGPKRLRMVHKHTSLVEFFGKVRECMPHFLVHNFRARWQGEQYRQCLGSFAPGTIVSNIDFAENYTFKVQNEIQSMHWDNKQITILVLCTYRHASHSLVEDARGDRQIVADYHFFISDDNKHDTLFVQHCLDLHWKWMLEVGITVARHIMWSDGCAAQFKACRPFYFVSRYFNKYGAPMLWCFHGSGHGKGVHDGLGGTVKTALQREELKGVLGHKLQNAHDAVEFCKKHFALGKPKEYGGIQEARRFFWEVGAQDVDRDTTWDCLPIAGTRDLHSFYGFSRDNPLLLHVRDMSCFCTACVEDDFESCINQPHVGQWKLHPVHPKRVADAVEYVRALGPGEGLEQERDIDHLAELITVGEFFAVGAHLDDEFAADFYVLQCTQKVHVVERDFEDGYKVKFSIGDRALAGLWYQQYGRRQTCFVLKEKAPVSYVLAADVVHVRFALQPTGEIKGTRSFTMPSDTLEAILGSLRYAGALEIQ